MDGTNNVGPAEKKAFARMAHNEKRSSPLREGGIAGLSMFPVCLPPLVPLAPLVTHTHTRALTLFLAFAFPAVALVPARAVFTGAIYGAVHTLSGHPLDNIKAKMQLDVNCHGTNYEMSA